MLSLIHCNSNLLQTISWHVQPIPFAATSWNFIMFLNSFCPVELIHFPFSKVVLLLLASAHLISLPSICPISLSHVFSSNSSQPGGSCPVLSQRPKCFSIARMPIVTLNRFFLAKTSFGLGSAFLLPIIHPLSLYCCAWMNLLFGSFCFASAFKPLPWPLAASQVWQGLFVERSPISEACQGVITTLQRPCADCPS